MRPLNIEDYEALIELWLCSGLASLRPNGRDSRDAIADLLDRYSADRKRAMHALWGIKVDGKLVGAVMATHDGRKGWINRLAVRPAHRRQGYGERLIAAAEGALRSAGITVIAALIERENVGSTALFARAGYHRSDSLIYFSKRDSLEA